MLNNKRNKLSIEILINISISLVISIVLFTILSNLTLTMIEDYLFINDIVLSDDDYFELDRNILNFSVIFSFIVFIILSLVLLKDKFIYIKDLINGINKLREGNYDYKVEVKYNNELTELAESINYLSNSEKEIKEKERKIKLEKEELIRNLSHDIRTPLTSIISYSELEISKDTNNKEYSELILKKAKQIKELTDLLLNNTKRNIEYYENGKLLITQLVEEFSESIEDDFILSINLNLSDFSLNVDVNELRRIFDNLASNIKKYALKDKEISLVITNNNNELIIKQMNNINNNIENVENNNIGLNSIRSIANNYEGKVEINKNEEIFEINIFLNL